jgi:UDP-3-O-[3-hydroxymyristoyl] glucosamine N-acyltransferase
MINSWVDFMLKNMEIDAFITKNRCCLSDWFSRDKIQTEGEFFSTQPIETVAPYSIVFCESRQYVRAVNDNQNISCVITAKHLADQFDDRLGIVVCEQPRKGFYELHNTLAKGISKKTLFTPSIQESAQIHRTAFIEKGAYIGDNVIIGPGAVVLANSYIEDDVIIGPNVVIGADGLEYKREGRNNKLLKVEHVGGVYLCTGVEIKANATVCRDVYFGFTRVGEGTKIGPLCNIAHRSTIGPNCLIAGNSTVGGSVKIGRDVWLGPSSTISDRISIEDGAKVTLGSVVVKNVKAGQTVAGFFAVDHSLALREYANLTVKRKRDAIK